MTNASAVEDDVHLPGVLHHYCPLIFAYDNVPVVDWGQPGAPSVPRCVTILGLSRALTSISSLQYGSTPNFIGGFLFSHVNGQIQINYYELSLRAKRRPWHMAHDTMIFERYDGPTV
jgi:hypothetical protein